MTKKEFIENLRKQVEAFGPYIDQLNAEYPENPVPDDQFLGDWFELFDHFVGQEIFLATAEQE